MLWKWKGSNACSSALLQMFVPCYGFQHFSHFPPCAGAIQRWGIPVETTRKPYSSCQGECVQDEQQPRTEKEQFVSIGTTVFLFCVLFVLEASDPVNCQASCKKSTIREQT